VFDGCEHKLKTKTEDEELTEKTMINFQTLPEAVARARATESRAL